MNRSAEGPLDDPAAIAIALRGLGLTTREAEVLVWVAEGKTNDEIATILARRPTTIAKHVQRILAKLGVERRTAAARLAFEALNRRRLYSEMSIGGLGKDS
jgi:DNA-binding CsgD family transcriptional regulator